MIRVGVVLDRICGKRVRPSAVLCVIKIRQAGACFLVVPATVGVRSCDIGIVKGGGGCRRVPEIPCIEWSNLVTLRNNALPSIGIDFAFQDINLGNSTANIMPRPWVVRTWAATGRKLLSGMITEGLVPDYARLSIFVRLIGERPDVARIIAVGPCPLSCPAVSRSALDGALDMQS